MNSQKAGIYIPPLSKTAVITTNSGDVSQVLLKGQANKAYIITGYYMFARNTALTTCTQVTLDIFDYWTCVRIVLDSVNLIPSTVCDDKSRISGINVPTFPGKDVTIELDFLPAWMMFTLYYTEVDV